MKKYLPVVLILIFASVFRFYHLDYRGLFTDEKFTLATVNGFWVGGANQESFQKEYFTSADFWMPKTIQDYFDATAHADFGAHIVYTAVLHNWIRIFGHSDFWLRLPSVIFNILMILLVYQMCIKYCKNRWIAIIAGLLLAVDPLNIAQSHIARSYTLSFLLVVASTWYFIKINTEKGNFKNFAIYTLLVVLSILNHYFNFLVPLGHAVIFLFLRNKNHLWKGFIAAAIVNIVVLFVWLNWGGGYNTFGFSEDKDMVHNLVANSPDSELSKVIHVATPKLVLKMATGLFYDIGVIGHGLFDKLRGINTVIASFFLAIATLILSQPRRNKTIKLLNLPVIILILLKFNYALGALIVSSAIFIMVIYGIKWLKKTFPLENSKGEFILTALGLFMLISPLIFVVNEALSSGHTTSLTHRYIGNAAPFAAIFLAVGMVRAVEAEIRYIPLFIFMIIFQTPAISQSIKNFFDDKSPYNAFFDPPRIKNPYRAAAKKIESMAVKGDTVLIPGAYRDPYEKLLKKDIEVSFMDAQNLNFYFKKDFDVIQHVDKNEAQKLILKKENGKQILIFDFNEEEFRY